jgi:competence protein ComEA
MQSRLIFSLISQPIIVISCLLAAAVLTCGGCGRDEADEGFTETGYAREISERAVEDSGKDHTEDEAAAASSVCVFVCGAVNREGVYELPEGARVIDAVNAAGGYSGDADTNYVNQAQYVTDTERVEIPTREEADALREAGNAAGGSGSISGLQGSGSASPGRQDPSSGAVNINTAGIDELMTLPGIGENKAAKIIEYREDHGRFGATEEIMNVSGIGSSVYDRMKDHITVE